MRTDYFANLTANSACPATQNQSGAAANPHEYSVAPPAPPAPQENDEAEKNGRALFTHYGKGYVHPDGRVETGTPEPTPRPAVAWPADLNDMLRRVSTAFEWTDTDRRDFIDWARRSPEGLADARVFLEAEAAKLPGQRIEDL